MFTVKGECILDWIDEVRERIKRKNQVLFSKNSEFLQDLILLIEEQKHQPMVLWAFEFADETVDKLCERYPTETRPREAVVLSKEWAAGKVKMPVVKHAILQVHTFAKEIDSLEDIALCHAIGQACGVVHANGHALGFPVYDLTAIVRHYGVDNCKDAVEKRISQYIERILYWQDNYKNYPHEWADFMKKN